MGISRNKLNIPGEKELQGHGVSYCVDCDANFFRDVPVAVIGCESAAVSGAFTLMFYTDRVHLVCESLEVTDTLTQRIKESTVHLHEGSMAKEILGDTDVEGLVLDDGTRLDVKGVFIELGAKGAIELVADLGVILDTETMRYIDTNKKQETNVPGVYAAGDICGPPWQVTNSGGFSPSGTTIRYPFPWSSGRRWADAGVTARRTARRSTSTSWAFRDSKSWRPPPFTPPGACSGPRC